MLRKSFCIFALLIVAFALAPKHAHAQTYAESVVYSFCSVTDCADGKYSVGNLIQAADGNFYGVTQYGGAEASCPTCGIIFKISPEGTYSVLHTFDQTGGSEPVAGLVQGSDGNLYGTTEVASSSPLGDSGGVGTIYKITPSGVFNNIYTFCTYANANGYCGDGLDPFVSLVQGTDGDFYGTTIAGGAYCCNNGSGQGGTIFKVTPSGVLTVLHSFCQSTSCSDGEFPSALVQGTDGNFYGTTETGGADSFGTFFKITSAGVLTTLYSFCSIGGNSCTDGVYPMQVVEGPDGNFYGSTEGGGIADGTIFKLTPSGTLTTLATFPGPSGGPYPEALSLGSDGNFYGVTAAGGVTASNCTGCGTIFSVTPTGTVATIYEFCANSGATCTDAIDPSVPFQAMDGNFYGASYSGGDLDDGAIYKISVSPALAAPVQLTLSASTITLGESVTLSWKSLNSFSTTMQQCYAFVPNSASGAGPWTGLQGGTMSNNIYSGSATIQPTANGVYLYAITCGGVESAQAVLHVGNGKAASSTTFSSGSPLVVGSVVPLMAAVFPEPYVNAVPTGTVSYAYGSQSIGSLTLNSSAQADLELESTGLAAGSYPITVIYSGDANYAGSKTTANVVLQGRPTTLSVTATPATVVEGESLTLASTVSGTAGQAVPTGSVSYSVAGTVIATANLSNGSASITVPVNGIPPGSYSILATYNGDSYNAPSEKYSSTIAIEAATKTTVTASATTLASGQAVTFTATVARTGVTGTPTGTVAFYGGSILLATETLTGGVATFATANTGSLPTGTYMVTTVYSGDTLDAVSTSPGVTITVYPPGYTTSTSLTITPTTTGQGQSVTFIATVNNYDASSAPTGTVTFQTGSTVIGTAKLITASSYSSTAQLVLNVPTGTAAGTYAVTASYSGDSLNQVSTSSSVNLTVIATTTTTLTISPNPVPADSAVTFTAKVKPTYSSGTPTGSVTFTAGSMNLGTAALSNGTAGISLTDFGIPAGSYPVTAAYSGDANNKASNATVTLVVQ